MTIGERIKILRKNKNRSQAEFAQSIGLKPNQLSKIENGFSAPSLNTIKRIAEELNITVDFLLMDETDSPEYRKRKNFNEELRRKIALIDTLDKEEREALIIIIDSLLKRKMNIENS